MTGTTPQRQREIAMLELRAALDAVAKLAEEVDRMGGRLQVIAHDLLRAEDNGRAGGISWLELTDDQIAASLKEMGC